MSRARSQSLAYLRNRLGERLLDEHMAPLRQRQHRSAIPEQGNAGELGGDFGPHVYVAPHRPAISTPPSD